MFTSIYFLMLQLFCLMDASTGGNNMKKTTVFLILRIVGTILAFFNLIMFFAMRPCWSGISSTLGYKGGANTFLLYVPIIICVLLFVILLADLILKAIFKKNWLQIVFLSVNFVFLAAIIVIIIMGAKDYMRFVWPNFFIYSGIVVILCALFILLFVYPKTVLKDNKYFKFGLLGLASAVAVALVLNIAINRITFHPVVYAVEDNYQIVFATNCESVSWVEVGGKEYYDSYSGSNKKYSKVHKVEIPMTELDTAKKYTVHNQKSIYCGPFGGFLGRDITESVEFKPVDTSDGIQYLSFSDIHMNDRLAQKTSSFVENYDFLVLAGDIISDVETFDDAMFTSLTAFEITGGRIPVVYARGNHDVKGRYGEELHKYVGAKGEDFFYTFYFDDIYGVVLDLGEDHDDGWWEYYGTAHYEEYHNRQIAFLTEEVAKHDYDTYQYHLVISHIPIPFVNSRHNHESVKANMTALLNMMDVDMYLCGHQHQIMIFEPGLIEPNTKLHYNPEYKSGTYNGYLTDFNFPSFMVSKQGFTFGDGTDITGAKSHIGFVVDVNLTTKKETCYYINSRGEKVDVLNMFAPKHYGTQIVVDLETKKFS